MLTKLNFKDSLRRNRVIWKELTVKMVKWHDQLPNTLECRCFINRFFLINPIPYYIILIQLLSALVYSRKNWKDSPHHQSLQLYFRLTPVATTWLKNSSSFDMAKNPWSAIKSLAALPVLWKLSGGRQLSPLQVVFLITCFISVLTPVHRSTLLQARDCQNFSSATT